MTLQQIEYVRACRSTGSITKAANMLFMTPSNLSKALKQLESEVGFDIFLRTSNGVTVTEKGEVFLSYADQIAKDIDAISMIKDRPAFQNTFVCLCSSVLQCFLAFCRLCKNFQEKEDYMLSLQQENDLWKSIEALKNRKCDVAICVLRRSDEKSTLENIRRSHIEAEFLGAYDITLLFRKGHPVVEAYQKTGTLDQELLSHYPFVDYSLKKGVFSTVPQFLPSISKLPIKRLLCIQDMEWKTKILSYTDGYSMGIRMSDDADREMGLVRIPLQNCRASLYMLCLADQKKSEIATRFLSYLREELEATQTVE